MVPDSLPILKFAAPIDRAKNPEFGRIAVSDCTTPFVLDVGLVNVRSISDTSSFNYTIAVAPVQKDDARRLNRFVGALDDFVIDTIVRKSQSWFPKSFVSAERVEEDYRKNISFSSKHKEFLFRFACTMDTMLPTVNKCHLKLKLCGIMFRRQNYTCLWSVHHWERDVDIPSVVHNTVVDSDAEPATDTDTTDTEDEAEIPVDELQRIKQELLATYKTMAKAYRDAIRQLESADASDPKLLHLIDRLANLTA